ncbi:MAG: hypothetical protein MUO58_09040, partial [Anaerolineales bacterium]|nr:hypothetical protein [Anaerolineales bacterium]
MDQIGLLLSYFREPDAALTALRTLGRKGFRRRILLQDTPDGRITRRDPSTPILKILILASGIITSAISVTLSLTGILPQLLSLVTWNCVLFSIIGFGIGAVIGWLASAKLVPSVSKSVREQQSSWLRSKESLLILQAPLQSLSSAVQTLRDSIETEISIFAIHPQRNFPEAPDLRKLTALPLPQIRAHAARLAKEHHVDIRGGPSRLLLDQLETARQTIHAICGDLTEAVRLEQSMGPVAEWILDNEYLIESHGRDVQINLPKSFYRELPSLTVDPDRTYPRVYSLAKELVA